MKKLSFLLLCILCICTYGCSKWLDEHFGIVFYSFYNDSDYPITVYDFLYEPSNPYPDTTLPEQQPKWLTEIPVNDFSEITCRKGPQYGDTVSIYVFDADILAKYGWDNVRDSNLVLQRYDITYNEFKHLRAIDALRFPPSEEMRDIKMWPPYGTYDENGHRVAQ